MGNGQVNPPPQMCEINPLPPEKEGVIYPWKMGSPRIRSVAQKLKIQRKTFKITGKLYY